jgi:hypothetical protein
MFASLLKRMTNDDDFVFQLGSQVRDTLTGFEGVVVCRAQWLNNCNTYSVKPRKLKDGIPQESHSFDEPQLELVEASVMSSKRDTGGPERPMPNPRSGA